MFPYSCNSAVDTRFEPLTFVDPLAERSLKEASIRLVQKEAGIYKLLDIPGGGKTGMFT